MGNTNRVSNFSHKKKTRKRTILKFNVLFSLIILLFIVALTQSLYFLMTSFSVKHDIVDYNESGNIDYKVYLKENDFYERDYLDKNMVYVSSLIKNILVTFNYDFNIDKKDKIDFEYEIDGKIIITDSTDKNTFFEKSYVLVGKEKGMLNEEYNYNIHKDVVIDYGYYNSLANNFKKSYGVNSKSKFVVTMKIKCANNSEAVKINNNNELTLTIPLSESEVNIVLDSSKLNNQNHQISTDSHIVITDKRKLIVAVLLGLISILLFTHIVITLFELKPRKNKYHKLIRKILREYDRLIVNTPTRPTVTGNKVVDVETFQELLDVRDNLKEPIKYYVSNKNEESIFYLNHENELYVLKISAEEFESDENGKNKYK